MTCVLYNACSKQTNNSLSLRIGCKRNIPICSSLISIQYSETKRLNWLKILCSLIDTPAVLLNLLTNISMICCRGFHNHEFMCFTFKHKERVVERVNTTHITLLTSRSCLFFSLAKIKPPSFLKRNTSVSIWRKNRH